MFKTKINDWMVKFDRWMWHVESAGSTKAHKGLWHSTRVLFAVIRDVVNGQITLHAMSLVYTTLLSIVPLLALSFSVLKAFDIHDKLEPLLEEFLLPLGDRAPEVIQKTLAYVDNIKVGVLGSVGLGLLIYWVISLVQKIERSFNEIWRVSTHRSFAQRFSNYLSVIMIGPVLMVAATGATTTFVGSDVMQQILSVEPFGWLFATLSRAVPYIVNIGVFTFLYVFIPNTRVKLKYALCGGIVAGVVWQSAIVIFTLTVAGSTKYTAIYSGFAVGILLLMWLYFSWLTLLVGASVAFYAQHSQQITRARVNVPSAEVDELTGLSILHEVGTQFYNSGHVTISELESNLSVGPEVIQRLLKRYQEFDILVVAEDNDTLYPARPFEELRMSKVLEILRAPEQPLPISITQFDRVMDTKRKIQQALDHVFDGQTVSQWIHSSITQDVKQPLILTNNIDTAGSSSKTDTITA